MKAVRVAVMAFALSALAMPAQAAVVGLLGGDFDPPPITDPTIFSFLPCNGGDGVHSIGAGFEDSMCIFYSFPFLELDNISGPDPITSIEFFLFGINTDGLGVDNGDGSPFYLQNLTSGDTQVPGAFRLSGGVITPNFCDPEDEGCIPVTALALVVSPSGDETLPTSFFGQVVAVNGVVTSVPEPATLLLLGPGVAAAAMTIRRRRQRKTNV